MGILLLIQSTPLSVILWILHIIFKIFRPLLTKKLLKKDKRLPWLIPLFLPMHLLDVLLAYRDTEGNFFMDPVFNETVQIVEFDEGFDSEVFFMYVFLVAGLFLVLFLVYSLIGGSKGKKNVAVSKAMETGTTNDDVDYEWIPRSALKTPGSNKTSPRQRKTQKHAGSDTE